MDAPKRQTYATTSPQKRLYYIDNLRVIACFLIILTHSTMPATEITDSIGFWIFTLSFIGSPASELFLTLSGTVILPIKSGIRSFYFKRFLKLLPPTIFWSIVGLVINYILDRITIHEFIKTIILIPLQPAIGVYWFIYVIIGLYLFAPIISAYLNVANKRQIELFLFLWIITLIMPWIYGFFNENFNQQGSHYWMLNYFGGFLGYWVLGFYLNKYPIHIGLNKKWLLLILLSFTYPVVIFIMKINGIYSDIYMDNLQIGGAVLVTLLYTLVQKFKLKNSLQKIMTSIAKYSFGIYLIHIFIVRNFIWMFFNNSSIHTFPRTFLIAVLSMALSWILIWAITKLPGGRYISGT